MPVFDAEPPVATRTYRSPLEVTPSLITTPLDVAEARAMMKGRWANDLAISLANTVEVRGGTWFHQSERIRETLKQEGAYLLPMPSQENLQGGNWFYVALDGRVGTGANTFNKDKTIAVSTEHPTNIMAYVLNGKPWGFDARVTLEEMEEGVGSVLKFIEITNEPFVFKERKPEVHFFYNLPRGHERFSLKESSPPKTKQTYEPSL